MLTLEFQTSVEAKDFVRKLYGAYSRSKNICKVYTVAPSVKIAHDFIFDLQKQFGRGSITEAVSNMKLSLPNFSFESYLADPKIMRGVHPDILIVLNPQNMPNAVRNGLNAL